MEISCYGCQKKCLKRLSLHSHTKMSTTGTSKQLEHVPEAEARLESLMPRKAYCN